MTIIQTDAGLFGPFERIEDLGDRLRVWPAGAAPDARGADLPFGVIGAYEELDVEVPPSFIASDYTWNGVSLVPLASALAPDPS
jgi:hypothetical protein